MILNAINVAGNRILDNISIINALLHNTLWNQVGFAGTKDVYVDDTFDEGGS